LASIGFGLFFDWLRLASIGFGLFFVWAIGTLDKAMTMSSGILFH
jgi:hypothetical protein